MSVEREFLPRINGLVRGSGTRVPAMYNLPLIRKVDAICHRICRTDVVRFHPFSKIDLAKCKAKGYSATGRWLRSYYALFSCTSLCTYCRANLS